MERKISILVVDDEKIALKRLTQILIKEDYDVLSVSEGHKAIQLIQKNAFDIVLTDLMVDEVNGLDILEMAKIQSLETEVIILTGYASVDTAIAATKKGAFHYLQKPIKPDEVRNIVRRCADKLCLSCRVRELEGELKSGKAQSRIIGNSLRIQEIKELILHLQHADANVLITGESGTGKELIARSLHENSPKKAGCFIAFNCASFNEELFANEIFGHEKDAYTGATTGRAGLLESANQGTVFFDEIGDMPLSMQAQLLRVIQERELIRVGGTQPIPIDIRIISATNKDLKELCNSGQFRQDLYFRLKVINIHLPCLSERREDIPLLATHFLRQFTRKIEKTVTHFSDGALNLLVNYGYPGNIRELENIIEHAVSMCRTSIIQVEDLPSDMAEFDAFTFHQNHSQIKTLEEIEAEYIHWVLEQVQFRKSEAAKLLGIDRTSLYRKLKRFEFSE